MNLDLTVEAQQDLGEILNFSIERWGPVRAFYYLEALDARMNMLASGELSGVAAGNLRPACGGWCRKAM